MSSRNECSIQNDLKIRLDWSNSWRHHSFHLHGNYSRHERNTHSRLCKCKPSNNLQNSHLNKSLSIFQKNFQVLYQNSIQVSLTMLPLKFLTNAAQICLPKQKSRWQISHNWSYLIKLTLTVRMMTSKRRRKYRLQWYWSRKKHRKWTKSSKSY